MHFKWKYEPPTPQQEQDAKKLIEKNSNLTCAPLYYEGGDSAADEAAVDTYAICVTKGQTELLNAINEVYQDWVDETGVKIYAISIDQGQNVNKVKPLVDEYGWTYDVLIDANSEFKRALGIQMIPYVLVCDGDGKIVYKHNGYTEGAENELIEKVRELVAAKK